MNDPTRWRDAARITVCATLAVCLGAAALQHGGVEADEWQPIAAVISVACGACLLLRSRKQPATPPDVALILLAAITVWMVLGLVPLPYVVVARFSPNRAVMVAAARALTGGASHAPLALSVAPAATVERLLFVLPAIAVFVAAREMPLWWSRERAWFSVAPVIAVALFEALVGIAQFNSAPLIDGVAPSVAGTYVNRNHFAGLLELGLPLTLTTAIGLWSGVRRRRRRSYEDERGLAPALQTGVMLLAAACLLAGVITSLSRMGFVTTLVSISTVTLGWLLTRRRHGPTWLWSVPLLLPLGVVWLVATNGMVLRFADTANSGDLSADGRMQIWRETVHLISAYPWTGAGLGTFEHALYPFRFAMSTNAVDYAHNDYLQIFAELGIVGLVLTVALALVIAWRAARGRSPVDRRGSVWVC
ncbi:MAG: O-antigen ligase family protein [Vicinamibacterales bacterium]